MKTVAKQFSLIPGCCDEAEVPRVFVRDRGRHLSMTRNWPFTDNRDDLRAAGQAFGHAVLPFLRHGAVAGTLISGLAALEFQLTQSRGSRQIVESRMVPAEHASSGLQGSLQERLGLAIAALDLIKERQIVDARKRTGMLLALAHC